MATVENVSSLIQDLQRQPGLSIRSNHIVDDDVRLIFQWLFYSIVSELISVVGVISNIVNLVIFIKLGFKDSVNISLFGLAVSDVGCLVSLMWTNICFNPAFSNLDLPFEPTEFQYMTGGAPHVIFTRVTSCITAFITVERCLCVTVPLKVKAICTSKRVTAMIIAMFIVVIGNMLPVFFVSRLAAKFSLRRNKTIIGLVFTKDRELIQGATLAFSSVFVPIAALIVVVVSTAVLVIKLRSKTKWRETSVAPGQTATTSSRDHKVTKMIVVISTFFIVCFTPVCLNMIAMIVEPDFSIEGRLGNLFVCVFGVCFTLEAINSATNMFIYYHMSSKYRAMLRQLFPSILSDDV